MSVGRLLLHRGWVCCPSVLSREREAGLGVSGLESSHRPWGYRQLHPDDCGLNCLGIFQIIWENKAFLGAAELCSLQVHQGQKSCPPAGGLSSCAVFSLVLSLAPADTISSFLQLAFEVSKYKCVFRCWPPVQQSSVSTAGFVHSTQPWPETHHPDVLAASFPVESSETSGR